MGQAAPTFRRGGEDAAKVASESGGARFARTHFFSLGEGEIAFLRYITDEPDWPFAQQHQSVPTKNKPADFEGNWPEAMPAVCRYDPAFQGIHTDCYICDAEIKNKWGKVNKGSVRNWALACLREEVTATAEHVGQVLPDGRTVTEAMIGKRIGFKDATRKVAIIGEDGKPTGEEKEERAIVVVNMAPGNYFNALSSTYAALKAVNGGDATICDRDFAVRRTGKEKDTEYHHTDLGQTPSLQPGTDSWKRYEDAVAEQGLDLFAIMADRASDEYYARFFDPTKTAPSTSAGGVSANSKPEVPQGDSGEPDPEALAAMRERVRAATSVAEVD